MTKKQYFLLWWALSSLASIAAVIVVVFTGIAPLLSEIEPAELNHSAGIMMTIAIAMISIPFQGFVLSMGMDFAKKIGARFLFLDDNYSAKNDILKPAIIIGVVVSCVACVINIAWPFELFSFFEKASSISFSQRLVVFLRFIPYDIQLLLFCVAGLALLIKKITKSGTMGLIVYMSIVLIAFLLNMSSPIWHFGIMAFAVGPMIRCCIDAVLGVLFWKKGFETAVLCHFIIVFIFYFIAPMIMGVIGV